ncbi:DUF6429 family protein [Effusibacillus consociatus]|uniref:DUF6429 family protein n=1 Tax=Effusibacillus consociatus TaxID=1117041 RepID=A0ABV9Q4R9_9BACL
MKDEDVDLKEHIKELTLLLLYLNSWIEKEWGFEYRRSWKGYDFDALNELAEEGVITDTKTAGLLREWEEYVSRMISKQEEGTWSPLFVFKLIIKRL